MSSLDPKDAVPDYSGLNDGQRKTLDQWESFFEKVRSGCRWFRSGSEWGPGLQRSAEVPLDVVRADRQRYNIVGKVVP